MDREVKTPWDIWNSNFYNARRFFKSKGNVKTRSKYKDKWYKEFEKDVISLAKQYEQEIILDFREVDKKVVGFLRENDISPDEYQKAVIDEAIKYLQGKK